MLNLKAVSINTRNRRLKIIFIILAGISITVHSIVFYFINETLFFLYPFFLFFAIVFVMSLFLQKYIVVGTIEINDSKISIRQPSQSIDIDFNDISKFIWFKNAIEGETPIFWFDSFYSSDGVNKIKIITTNGYIVSVLFLIRSERQMDSFKELIKNINKVSKRRYTGIKI